MNHIPVLLDEILTKLPGDAHSRGNFLDCTAGGGGHFLAILSQRANWSGECWDRDPLARERLETVINKNSLSTRARFAAKNFGDGPDAGKKYELILADLGVSSFQLDDLGRGMSLFSDVVPDFRMNPNDALPLFEWIRKQDLAQLIFILEEFGEEPRAKKLAEEMKTWSRDVFSSCKVLAAQIEESLDYRTPSKIHPATRTFQALRIAVNDELGELKKLLKWAPSALAEGGILAIISFHSVEDRMVKNAFKDLADTRAFDILTKKPMSAGEKELEQNPRSRSAKLRLLKKSALDA